MEQWEAWCAGRYPPPVSQTTGYGRCGTGIELKHTTEDQSAIENRKGVEQSCKELVKEIWRALGVNENADAATHFAPGFKWTGMAPTKGFKSYIAELGDTSLAFQAIQ